ncbi:DNA repair protein RecO [Salegentibacter chungangensis]|uniref:DNA repair protein RecO n=1 Tax=Salegentibacter chungangensis TaxID=1335724 RepID=A0ABW3NNR6_9FLAO
MLVNTKAIVISALKYGEADLIVKAYTLESGLKTYMLRGVLKSRKGKFKASQFQLLTQLEIIASHKDKGTLEYLKEAKVIHTYASLHTNVVKSSLVMFLAEMLKNSIQEEESNPALYAFLEHSFEKMDEMESVANFHLFFLLKLTAYLGFQPDDSEMDQPYFNLLEGTFENVKTNNYCVEGANLEILRRIMTSDIEEVQHLKLNQTSRKNFLNMLLLYYELHIEGFRKPKSLSVLNEIFN